MPKVTITTDNKTIDVVDGYPLIDMCEDHDTSILFGCRDGACGACMVKIIQGSEKISPMKDDEKDFLWMSEQDIQKNAAEHGWQDGLRSALAAYRNRIP